MKHVSTVLRARRAAREQFLSSTVLTAGIFLGASPFVPHAALAAQAAAASDLVAEEIIVTGSRIVRDGYEAPTPTTVVAVQDILARAPANIADYINQMPQLGNATSPRTTRGSSNTISGSSNLLNMRGLGTARTLVLLDGRRVVSAGLNSAVDLNLLPTNLTSRVDIVTGGASAAYGSDAVAGVTNIILDAAYTGVKGSMSYGMTEYGDGETFTADAAAGTSFGGGRGHVLASAQVMRQNGIDTATQRDWYRPGFRTIANPAFVLNGSQPASIPHPQVAYSTATDGGVIITCVAPAGQPAYNTTTNPCPLRGTAFGEGGQVYQFRFGTIIAGNSQAGGTTEDSGKLSPLMSDMTNWNTFARVSYDFTDNIRGDIEAGFGKSDSWNWSATASRFGNLPISIENPYLPASVVQQMAANNITTLMMGRVNGDIHYPNGHVTSIGYHRQQKRFLAGLEGDFLDSGHWSAYYQNGTSDVRYNYFNMTIPNYFTFAADAVRNPATGGVAGVPAGMPVCRSTLTNPTNACVPANIFGTGLLSPQTVDYITGVNQGFAPAQQDIDILQEVYALDVQYEPFSTWAGPVSTAVGIERRRERYTSVVDRASSMGLWFGGGFTPSTGRFTVLEYYGETIIPILRDVPLVQSLDINGAIRRTDYSTSGKVTTWKVGATWDIDDQLRARATMSRDIRAPNLLELFNGGVATVSQTRDPTQTGSPTVFTRQITGGNPLLTPEIARTYTFGAVYRPDWLVGFSAAVDYYKITVRDAITPVSGQNIVDQCFGVGVPQNPAACNSIVRANPNNLVDATIYTGGLNAQQQRVEGVDFEFSYRTQMSDYIESASGSLDLRLLASRRIKSHTILAGALTNALGTTGDGPKWRALFSASYLQGPSRTTLTARYLGSGVINNWPLGHPSSVGENHYDSITYFEIAQNYDLTLWGVNLTVFGVIENLLDSDPPPIPSAGLQSIGADALHDLLGRSYRAGIRYSF